MEYGIVVAGIIWRCFFQCLAFRGEDGLKFDELSGVCVVGYENFRTALALDRGNKLTEGGKALLPTNGPIQSGPERRVPRLDQCRDNLCIGEPSMRLDNTVA